jgi:hypothetical protein
MLILSPSLLYQPKGQGFRRLPLFPIAGVHQQQAALHRHSNRKPLANSQFSMPQSLRRPTSNYTDMTITACGPPFENKADMRSMQVTI